MQRPNPAPPAPIIFLHIGPLTAVGFRLRADGRKRLCPLRQETRRLAWKRKQERLSSIHALGFFHPNPGLPQGEQSITISAATFAEKKHDHSHNVVVGTKSLELIFRLFFIGSVDEQKNIEFTSYCPRHNHNNSAASQKIKVNRPRPMVSSLRNSKANSMRSWMQRCVQKQECKGYFVLLLPKARTCFQSSNWKYLLPGKPTAGLLLKRWQPTWGLINLLHPYMFLFFDKDRCISWKVLEIFGALAFFLKEEEKMSRQNDTPLSWKQKTLPSL